jgi:HAD superfamily hydrolase (TIGR01509 family)
MRLPDAVVFDFDGVILDSETPEYESHRRVYERFGVTLTVADWCDCIGVDVDRDLDRWSRRLREHAPGAPDHEAFRAEVHQLFAELVPREPMPGIASLIAELTEAGVACGIASNSPARWVMRAAESIGVASCMQAVVTKDDVVRGKPAPDVYLEAVRRLGATPSRSFAVEDSAPGLAAARAAGLRTIAVPHWLTLEHDLSAADVRVADARDITLGLLQNILEECI